MANRSERSYPEPPANPSDEELSRDWTLSAVDRLEVLRSRCSAHRHRFALQLCALRTLGTFIDDVSKLPVRITNHVGRQLGLPPLLFLEDHDRPATATEQAQRIREYIGYRPFDDDAEGRIKAWLSDRVAEGAATSSLPDLAVSALRSWKTEIPGRWTFDRLIGGCAAHGEDEAWRRIASRLSPEFCAAVDRLLEVGEDAHRSMLFRLKQAPPQASPSAILDYLDRFAQLQSLGAGNVDLAGIMPPLVRDLAESGERYDVDDLKRFAPAKRHALVACFLVEKHKTTIDYLVEMNRQWITTMMRGARQATEKREARARQQAEQGTRLMTQALRIVLDSSMSPAERIEKMLREVAEDRLLEALTLFDEIESRNDIYVDELLGRHSHLKQYLPRFMALPFRAEPGTETLLEAIDIARKLYAGTIKALPNGVPTQFVAGALRDAVTTDGKVNVRIWELALAFAVRDALRSGNLYLAESRHYVSFWKLIYSDDTWSQKREHAYADLRISSEPNHALDALRAEFDQVARSFMDGLAENRFASLRDGALVLTRREANPEPSGVQEIRDVIGAHLPPVRIENVLMEVDSWCGFTRELTPLGGYRPRTENLYPALLAALVAHGTNLGIAVMSQCTEGLTVDMLHHVSQWYLRTDTLKAANRALVNYHHQIPISSVWGDGGASSSDGQRFGVQASSVMASFHPRYFGYYDRAVTVYTHVSNQFSVFASRVISCTPREAIYVLDGLLENDTLLKPREHYTDTHGYTEQLFGLCYLLGYSFMPRLKDLKDQQLYRLDRATSYGALDSLFRGVVDVALIREQWDQLVRVASSLKDRTTPAHVVLDRLAAGSPSDRLAKALTMLGRVVKTVSVLRYLHDSALRDRVHLQLNRGEHRHALTDRLFFGNQGDFRTGDREEMMNKVSALSLLSNAVLVWNSVRIAEIVGGLERSVARPVRPEILARVSPLWHGHVIANGSYHFGGRRARAQA